MLLQLKYSVIKKFSLFLLGVLLLLNALATRAHTEDNTASNLISYPMPPIDVEFVTVGDPNNYGCSIFGFGDGWVYKTFQIGKYDITAYQYCAFLNAVAVDDIHNLYRMNMHADEDVACLLRHGSPGHYFYSVLPGREKLPITYVNWYSAVRFCNWMHNGQPIGAQNESTTEEGAYTLDSLFFNSTCHEDAAKYYLPSFNEWYKAAYYKGGSTDAGYWYYPTQNNSRPGNKIGDAPNQANYMINPYWYPWFGEFSKSSPPYITDVGAFSSSPGPYGTYDMVGNVYQWIDDLSWTNDESNSNKDNNKTKTYNYWQGIYEGGAWDSCNFEGYPDHADTYRSDVGFRIAAPSH